MSFSGTNGMRRGVFDWVVDRSTPRLAGGDAISAPTRPITLRHEGGTSSLQTPGATAWREGYPFPGQAVLEITRSFPSFATDRVAAGGANLAVLFVGNVPHRTAVDPAIHACFFGSLANFSTCRPRAFDVVLSWEPRSAAELLHELAFHANLLRTGGLLQWRIALAIPTDIWVSLRTEARRRGLRLLDLEPLQPGIFLVTFRR
ncbi:MAG: hypothetical protein U1D30_08365 [Planctomycetota bacterium]